MSKDKTQEQTQEMETSKPLLFAESRTDAEKFDPRRHRGTLDPSRVPGYSEIVQANDIAKADPLIFRDRNGITQEDAYALVGAQPQELEVEFMWLPVSGAAGAPSDAQARALDRYENQEGFRLCTVEFLKSQPWFQGMPPLGRVAEDGTIRRGPDVALFWRPGEVARAWEAFKIAESRELQGAPPEEVETVTLTH